MEYGEREIKPIASRTVCADGTSLSIQASGFHYSLPRDNKGPYVAKEVGYIQGKDGAPLAPPKTWAQYSSDGVFPTAVYGWVPVGLIEAFIAEHGGIAKPAIEYSPAQVAEAEKAKRILARVLADPKTRICGVNATQLYVWAHNLAPISEPA